MTTQKKYTIKVYDKTGATYKGNYGQVTEYSFTSTINGGIGELKLTLPRKFDDYNNNGDLELLDHIEVWVQDRDTTGRRIYNGFIEEIEAKIGEGEEKVVIRAVGYVAKLAFSLNWNGSTALRDRRTGDPTANAKAVIDTYNSLYTDPFINYTATSTENAGYSVTTLCESKSVLESLEIIRELAPSTFYWFVDADNVFWWKAKPTTPTHSFVFTRDISEMTVKKTTADLRNVVLYWNGRQEGDKNYLSKRYYNSASITSYWERFSTELQTDYKTTTEADKFGSAAVTATKNPNVSITFKVKDNNLGSGYDIESIQCGDTCRILNLNDSDIYSGNLQITKTLYTPEWVEVTVEDVRAITSRKLTDVLRRLHKTQRTDSISAVTSSSV